MTDEPEFIRLYCKAQVQQKLNLLQNTVWNLKFVCEICSKLMMTAESRLLNQSFDVVSVFYSSQWFSVFTITLKKYSSVCVFLVKDRFYFLRKHLIFWWFQGEKSLLICLNSRPLNFSYYSTWLISNFEQTFKCQSENLYRDLLQISLPVLREFKRINELLFPLKSSENHRFFNIFKSYWFA